MIYGVEATRLPIVSAVPMEIERAKKIMGIGTDLVLPFKLRYDDGAWERAFFFAHNSTHPEDLSNSALLGEAITGDNVFDAQLDPNYPNRLVRSISKSLGKTSLAYLMIECRPKLLNQPIVLNQPDSVQQMLD